MQSTASVILSLLTVLVLASPVKANQEVQEKVQPTETVSHSDSDFSRGIGQLLVSGLTLYLLIQVSNKK